MLPVTYLFYFRHHAPHNTAFVTRLQEPFFLLHSLYLFCSIFFIVFRTTTDSQYADASNEPSFSKQKNNNVKFIPHHNREKAQYDMSMRIKNMTCLPPETVFTNINQLSMIINKKRLCTSMDASFGKTLFTCMLVPAVTSLIIPY